MALVPCPHCGKPISDSAVNCVHCGKSLLCDDFTVSTAAPMHTTEPKQEQTQPLRTITDLSKQELKDLQGEFANIFPVQAKVQKQNRIAYFCSWIFIFAALFIALAMYIVFEENRDAHILFIALAVLAVVCIIVSIVATVFYRKGTKKYLYSVKVFATWLKECKQIDMPFVLNQKHMATYNSLTLTDEDMRRIKQ